MGMYFCQCVPHFGPELDIYFYMDCHEIFWAGMHYPQKMNPDNSGEAFQLFDDISPNLKNAFSQNTLAQKQSWILMSYPTALERYWHCSFQWNFFYIAEHVLTSTSSEIDIITALHGGACKGKIHLFPTIRTFES